VKLFPRFGPSQLQQLCASFAYFSPNSKREVAGCNFHLNYYGGLGARDLLQRLHSVQLYYRLDQLRRLYYQVCGSSSDDELMRMVFTNKIVRARALARRLPGNVLCSGHCAAPRQ